MNCEYRCSRCGNISDYKKDGKYTEYIMLYVNSGHLPHQESICAQSDLEARKKFSTRKSCLKNNGCFEIKLLKKITEVKRERKRGGQIIKILVTKEIILLA